MKFLPQALLCIVFTFLTGCSDDDNAAPVLTEEEQTALLLTELRAATAGYADIEMAIDAGWDTDLSGCVEHPAEGGMGHHYARMAYMDGRVNHLEPQVLLYAMDENQQMEFLGVEYIVPFALVGPDQTPPRLFFQDFHANHEQGFWALHVWSERDNPNGLFTDWNTTVSCDNWIAFQVDEVRAATAAYHDFNAATSAGWDTDLSGCVEHPTEGGMGHHYGRMAYMDGRVNHLEPQVLLFAPDANANMEFLGVEYLVPFTVHPADEAPPVLFNQEYHANHEQGFWALHLWSERDNPNGLFYDWNPTVGCN